MNKYQKIASQVAKDMIKKEMYKNWSYKRAKNGAMGYFIESRISLAGARAYKNYFKDKWY